MKESFIRFLRFTEKYTKTDMLYLFKGGFWLSTGQFVSSASALITSIVFANLLAPEIFGIYKYIISIMGLLAITTLAGMDSAITQAVSRGFEGTLVPAIKTKMKWGLLGSGFSILIAIYYYIAGNTTISLSFAVVALFMPFIESFDMYNSLLLGKKYFHTQTIYNSIKKIISLIAIILTVWLSKNIYLILFVYLSSIILPNLYFLLKTVRSYKKNENIDKDAIPYGKRLSAIYILSLITTELDKILVFQYVGPVYLVIYSLASAPIDQIKGLLKNVNSLAISQFSQKTLEEIKKNIWNKVRLLAIGTSIIISIYIILAPLFFSLFFPRYISAVPYSQVLAVSLIPIVLAGFIYTALEAQKAQDELYKYNTYSNIMSIVILLPLVYYFGIWGAVLARLLTRSATFVYSIHLMKRA